MRAERVVASEQGADHHPRENTHIRHPRESGDPVAFVPKAPECGKDADLDSALAMLPVGLLEGADKVMDTLWGIGVRTIGDVLALSTRWLRATLRRPSPRPDRSRARQPARCACVVRGAGALLRAARVACARA